MSDAYLRPDVAHPHVEVLVTTCVRDTSPPTKGEVSLTQVTSVAAILSLATITNSDFLASLQQRSRLERTSL